MTPIACIKYILIGLLLYAPITFGDGDASGLIYLGDIWREIDKENQVRYFNDEKMSRAEYVIRNGLFYHYDTGKVANFIFPKNIVVDESHRVFIVRRGTLLGHKHSAPVRGGPVYFAGEVLIRNGKLIRINTNSGHYTPGQFHLYEYLIHLKNAGADLTGVKVGYYNFDNFEEDALKFIRTYEATLRKALCGKFYGVTAMK